MDGSFIKQMPVSIEAERALLGSIIIKPETLDTVGGFILPEDFYDKYGMSSDVCAMDLIEKRSQGFTKGLMAQEVMLETVIPMWETEGKDLTSLVLMPVRVSCGEGKHIEGLPQPAKDTGFIDRLAEMSRPYGVEITMENGVAVCRW